MNALKLTLKVTTRTWHLLRLLRLRQWLKNLALLAPIVFSGQLFDGPVWRRALTAALAFCLASSAAYGVNDVVDAERDRHHPFKKLRPVASGKISPRLALAWSLLLATSALWLARDLNPYFRLSLTGFLILQVFYSLVLRNLIIIDALTVALAFLVRLFAGSFATQTSVSSWLILSTIGLSLLLAFGKRRSERTLLNNQTFATRATLLHYPDTLLDSMISVSAAFALISYCLFSFQISPSYPSKLFSALLPPTLVAPKWMMLTIPFVIYGVARYLYVIYEKKEGESPERVLLSDRPLTLTVIFWILTTIFVIYFLGT